MIFTVNGEPVPAEDTICECGHWYDEHDRPVGDVDDSRAFCASCDCQSFRFSEHESTPEAVADRGGDPDLWPEHVKLAIPDPYQTEESCS